MKRIYLLFIALVCLLQLHAQSGKHVFSLGKSDFLMDGKPLQLISGELHPSRIPREYWRHRIQMTRAMGCNAIAVYVMWNHIETAPGKFDFASENRDVAAFIRLCKEEGMWVLLRPGPYVCGEWDFGGIPPYLLKIPDIKIRCRDPRYMAAVGRYVQQLSAQVKALQCTNGGPIVMVQVENEYGSFGNDKEYLEALRRLWVKNGITVPFYTADGPTPYMLEAGNIDGAAIGMDSGGDQAAFDEAAKRNPNVPAFSSETYPGWLTHWNEKWAKTDTIGIKKELDFLLSNRKSFNFYVIHGGTNFGFTAGANAFSPVQYQPDVTSYDYDAPIDEQGRPTPKYFALRNLIKKYVTYKVPEVPAAIPTISIPEIKMTAYSSVWQNLSAPVHTPQPVTMEALDQNQGLMLYRTKLIGHKSGTLKIWEPHDYALVFLDGKFIDTVYRDGGKWEVKLPKSDVANPELDILVEGMGHINFAQFMIDRKGITDRVTLNGMTLMNWDIYKAPLDEAYVKNLKASTAISHDGKAKFFKGTFALTQTGDTYFDLSGYSKGVVYVNGHNLGRYWHVGPQYRLFCPASWLKKGHNEILVMDMMQASPLGIKAVPELY